MNFYKHVVSEAQIAKLVFCSKGVVGTDYFIGFGVMGSELSLQRLVDCLYRIPNK
jgi:hypothetical protein